MTTGVFNSVENTLGELARSEKSLLAW